MKKVKNIRGNLKKKRAKSPATASDMPRDRPTRERPISPFSEEDDLGDGALSGSEDDDERRRREGPPVFKNVHEARQYAGVRFVIMEEPSTNLLKEVFSLGPGNQVTVAPGFRLVPRRAKDQVLFQEFQLPIVGFQLGLDSERVVVLSTTGQCDACKSLQVGDQVIAFGTTKLSPQRITEDFDMIQQRMAQDRGSLGITFKRKRETLVDDDLEDEKQPTSPRISLSRLRADANLFVDYSADEIDESIDPTPDDEKDALQATLAATDALVAEYKRRETALLKDVAHLKESLRTQKTCRRYVTRIKKQHPRCVDPEELLPVTPTSPESPPWETEGTTTDSFDPSSFELDTVDSPEFLLSAPENVQQLLNDREVALRKEFENRLKENDERHAKENAQLIKQHKRELARRDDAHAMTRAKLLQATRRFNYEDPEIPTAKERRGSSWRLPSLFRSANTERPTTSPVPRPRRLSLSFGGPPSSMWANTTQPPPHHADVHRGPPPPPPSRFVSL